MAESKATKLSKRLSNPELRCKNGCGFYGNAIYMGYCSKCYKELVRDVSLTSSTTESQKVSEDEENEEEGDLGLGKLISRRTLLAAAKRRGKLLRGKGSNSKLSSSGAGYTASGTHGLTESKKSAEGKSLIKSATSTPTDFAEFLNSLKKPAAKDVVDQLQAFSKQVKEKPEMNVDNLGQLVQDFYQFIMNRLETHSAYKGVNEDQQTIIINGCEKHVMAKLFKRTFSSSSSDDSCRDVILAHRMKQLEWVKPEHLEMSLDLCNEAVVTSIHKARQELLEIDSKKSPLEKLQCVVKCCNSIFEALRYLSSLGADNFVPSLIYTIIISQPPRLQSNIKYISRFAIPHHVMSGETGYCFTNLCGAVSFIERCSARKFKISEEDYNRNMGYIDGKTDLDLMLAEDESAEEELVLTTQSCLDAMKDLRRRQQLMIVESREMAEALQEFTIGIRQQVNSILSTPPPRSYFARRFDRLKSADSPDGTNPAQGSFMGENNHVIVNPIMEQNLIDLRSPTTNSTTDLVPDEQR